MYLLTTLVFNYQILKGFTLIGHYFHEEYPNLPPVKLRIQDLIKGDKITFLRSKYSYEVLVPFKWYIQDKLFSIKFLSLSSGNTIDHSAASVDILPSTEEYRIDSLACPDPIVVQA